MTLRRLLGRPSWSILAGVVPLILVAAILGETAGSFGQSLRWY